MARSYSFLKMKGDFILKLIVAFTLKLLKRVEGGGGKIIFVASKFHYYKFKEK